MKIDPAVAGNLFDAALKATGSKQPVDAQGFTDALEKALTEMRTTVESGERAAADAMAGRGDLQSVVEALTATEMALETTVVIRDKVVEAYQEIMRMPI